LIRLSDKEQDEITQIMRFVIIGGVSVCLDLIVYYILIKIGLSLMFAKGVSFCAGMVFGFSGNKYWTFRSQEEAKNESISYLLIYGFTFFINVSVNGMVFNFATTSTGNGNSHALIIAFISATFVSTVLNYFGIRFITFKKGINARHQ
jgi:putative flippase GtrA